MAWSGCSRGQTTPTSPWTPLEGEESNQMAYCEAYSRANHLINCSMKWHRCQHILDAGRYSRRVWSAVCDLLHSGNVSDSQSLTKDMTLPSVDPWPPSLLTRFAISRLLCQSTTLIRCLLTYLVISHAWLNSVLSPQSKLVVFFIRYLPSHRHWTLSQRRGWKHAVALSHTSLLD